MWVFVLCSFALPIPSRRVFLIRVVTAKTVVRHNSEVLLRTFMLFTCVMLFVNPSVSSLLIS